MTPVGVHARRCAEARKRLVRVFDGTAGLRAALGLLGVRPPYKAEDAQPAATLAATLGKAFTTATLFVSDISMVDLVDAAAPAMPDQPLRETDVPTGVGAGLLWFAEPLPDRTGVEPLVDVQALAWQTLPERHALLKAGHGSAVLLTAFGAPAGSGPVEPIASVVWEVGALIGTAHGEVPGDAEAVPGFYQRVAAAFWTLLAQPRVVEETMERPLPPSERKRHRRAGVIDPGAPVRIIRVAGAGDRERSAESCASGSRLRHRHVVRGHWRAQWHPSLQEHRQIWISAFIKGPSHAPLLGGERVLLAAGAGRQSVEAPR